MAGLSVYNAALLVAVFDEINFGAWTSPVLALLVMTNDELGKGQVG